MLLALLIIAAMTYGRFMAKTWVLGSVALTAMVWTFGPSPVANAAPVFDVDGYTACTATTAATPDRDFDTVVTDCCVQHAGVPAPTTYGMGCVAPTDAASADERPTIVLPMRALPADDPDRDLQALIDMPLPDPPP
jgi:hypothetical protein